MACEFLLQVLLKSSCDKQLNVVFAAHVIESLDLWCAIKHTQKYTGKLWIHQSFLCQYFESTILPKFTTAL